MSNNILLILLIILIVVLIIICFILFKNIDSHKQEFISLKNKHTGFEKKVNTTFKNINSSLKKIPSVNKKIDIKIDELISASKEDIEKYVIDSFEKVDSDIIFTSCIDEFSSKTISLKDILKEKKDHIKITFQKMLHNLDTINTVSNDSREATKEFKNQITTEFKKLKDEVSTYNENYNNGQKLKNELFNRLERLEEYMIEEIDEDDSGIPKNIKQSLSGQTDTFDDNSFKIDKNDIENLSVMSMDEPKEDLSYRKRYM